MSETAAETSNSSSRDRRIRCRRCAERYMLPADASPRLSACPHCGASPRPLRFGLNRNQGSVVLAWTALVLLVTAYASPFLVVTKLGQAETHTLPGGVLRLFREGHSIVALVLFLFSIVFPVLKLLLTIISTTRLARLKDETRRRLVRFAIVTGKYSMLDILVVAVLIVSVQIDGLASVQPGIGVGLFTLAILLSAASGWLVNLAATGRTAEVTA